MAKAERTNHKQSTATSIKTASQAHRRFVALMSAMAASGPAPTPRREIPPKWQRTQKRQLASLDVHEFALKPPQVYNDRQKTCRFACKRRAELAMIFAI
jgi:hypothetical protein